MTPADQYIEIFAPFTKKKIAELSDHTLDFVHYTSASNALRILRDKSVTLRNASLMNDFSEIDHGERCLVEGWKSKHGKGSENGYEGSLASLLNSISPTIMPAVEQAYDRNLNSRKMETYLLSLSEHNDVSEGKLGKLSMWRAYGGKTNVALVIRREMLDTDNESGAFTAPVIYCDVKDFAERYFKDFFANLQDNRSRLQEMDRDDVVAYLNHSLSTLAMSTKHPGFLEEHEWRVIYAPWLNIGRTISTEVIDIQGIPQKVHRVSLAPETASDDSISTIPNLLKRIIIGPTEHPWVLYDAFVTELKKLGISDADKRVITSEIPIRR